MAINVTIQAAGDAFMTGNNLLDQAFLPEDDPRRMYGLPNLNVIGMYPNQELDFLDSPRWDTVRPKPDIDQLKAGLSYNGTALSGRSINPTTTAFELRCERITHEFADHVAVSPIPAFDTSSGNFNDTGTPGQLNNIVLALGMRQETIKLEGFILDRGSVSAANPRSQTLLNIARTQYLKISRGGHRTRWGGEHATPLNIYSYPCLTLGRSDSTLESDAEPSLHHLSYRGLIKNLSFRLEGGRPDQWFFTMDFQAIKNEHDASIVGREPWRAKIDRIRLISQSSLDAISSGVGRIEIRVNKSFEKNRNSNGGVENTLYPGTTLFLHGTNSVPTINGEWKVYGDEDTRTLIIGRPNYTNSFNEKSIWLHDNAENTATGEYLLWDHSNFTAGNSGTLLWGEGYSNNQQTN